jgi:hypothetical protein
MHFLEYTLNAASVEDIPRTFLALMNAFAREYSKNVLEYKTPNKAIRCV